MPYCKNCHSRISKLDKDICPVCGEKHPLEGVTSDTIDITHEIDIKDKTYKGNLPCRKNTVLLLFALIGWTGIGFIYLKSKFLKAFIWFLINAIIIAGIGSILFFFTPLKILGFIICILFVYIFNLCVGLSYKIVPNRKDEEGELIL